MSATHSTGWSRWRRRHSALRARAGVAAALLLGLLNAPPAWAQDTAAADDGPATALEMAEKDQFVLEVQAPDALADLLRRHLDLRRFQRLPDLTRSEIERLVAEAPANARQLLGTQGYFNAVVGVQVDDAQPPTIRVQVDAGPRTQVAHVQLMLEGDARDNPAASEQRERLIRQWGLPAGEAFSQSAWAGAKATALRELTALRYPQAQLQTTLADIDPSAHAAHLYVVLDSGPPYAFGPIRVSGAERYEAAMAERLVRLAGVKRGEPYDEATLQAAQRRLTDSGYYESAFVLLGDTENPADTPVDVELREAKLQKITAGVGASTDRGARLSLEHIHHRVPGLGWRATSALKLEQRSQTVGVQLLAPVDDRGWHWTGGVQGQREVDGLLTTSSQQWRAGRLQESPTQGRSLFLQVDRSREHNAARSVQADPALAVSANIAWTRRAFNDLTAPTSGHGLAVELGAGLTLAQERRPYGRAKLRWQGFWPLAASSERPSRLALRLEGGVVWARQDSPVPASQRFLAGGDNSVRGYAVREIGVPGVGGVMEPGLLLSVASLEWQRPIWADGQRSAWESALFVDAGAVANSAQALEPHVGLGAGVRYRSPVGPLQMDLAYGVKAERWRLHLSVGFIF